MKRLTSSLVLLAFAACAQQPRVTNAKLETRAASGGLDREVRSISGPAWIGYSVPSTGSRHGDCPILLEGDHYASHQPEGESRETAVLVRIEGGTASRIRVASADCDLDAGGLPFTWLTGVAPAESVRWLSAQAETERLTDSAVLAIALHADPAAGSALDQFTAPSRPERMREKAAFWLGAARGDRGLETLKRMLRDDPSQHVRKKVVFAISISKGPAALDALIAAARNDQDVEVRSQAIFWLGQKAGKKAAGAITDALENDPDTAVKKRAVFALSQLKNGEGVPLLIQAARTNRNPAVRKQAMFWLGQSKDPRALGFFEEVLKH